MRLDGGFASKPELVEVEFARDKLWRGKPPSLIVACNFSTFPLSFPDALIWWMIPRIFIFETLLVLALLIDPSADAYIRAQRSIFGRIFKQVN